MRDEQILGILTGVIRDGKELSFDDWRYKLYVNTWCRWYPLRIALLRGKHFAGRCVRKLRHG